MVSALIVFLVSYLIIASERFPRQAIALLGAVALVLLNVFSIQEAFTFVDWETIGLLFGMFILIMILAEAGFFAWFAHQVVVKLHYRPTYTFIVLPLVAAALAALMDSVTVMLFLSPLSLRIARMMKIDPASLIAAEVCAANTGGTATLIGNPPNVILGTMLNFNFNDFLVHTAPISVVATVILVSTFYFFNRKMLRVAETQVDPDELASHDIDGLVTDRRTLILGLIGFLVAVLLMVSHKVLATWFGIALSPATSALVPALIVMMLGGDATRAIMRKIDMESLLFFIGLFIIIGALEKTQFIAILANALFALAKDNRAGLIGLLYWGSGFASAVVDNIPMALAMAYVAREMPGVAGTPFLGLVVWAVALGVGMGGNITPVGASPNVIAYSYLEHADTKIGWPRWIKMTVPPTIAAMLVAGMLLYLKYLIGWY